MTLILTLLLPMWWYGSIPYKLLDKIPSLPNDPPKQVGYRVSIDQCIADEESIERTVCQVIEDQKPDNYDVLGITVYYKVARYDRLWGETTLEGGKSPHPDARKIIAVYFWNRNLTGDSRSRLLLASTKGCDFSKKVDYRRVNFDHTRSCR